MMSNQPKIEEIQALDGKVFAMLDEHEQHVLRFYTEQGRKFGVAVSIINEADSRKLAAARSPQGADEIMKSANSRVYVQVERELGAITPTQG
ncbi:hypothetical protein D3C81_327690 [compost metagenome]